MKLKVINTPLYICKEELNGLSFPHEEVLENENAREKRRLMLDNAMRLGNTLKRKVKIFFQDNQGAKQVETTVWAIAEGNAVFKGGRLIPIKRIFDVQFY